MKEEAKKELIAVLEKHRVWPVVVGWVEKDGTVISLVNGSPKDIVQILENMLKKHKSKLN